MGWILGSLVGFAAATSLVVLLGRSVTARYEVAQGEQRAALRGAGEAGADAAHRRAGAGGNTASSPRPLSLTDDPRDHPPPAA